MTNNVMTISVRSGDRFEFWARGAADADANPLVLKVGDRIVYRIERLPLAYTYFEYTHYKDEALDIVWDPAAIEISQFHYYNPAEVVENGVAHIELGECEGRMLSDAVVRQRQADDPHRPQLRFSPATAWINDPNGLCKVGDSYHLFYQFHPNSVNWGPIHWGHAISEDLYHWRHLPVFLHPQNNLAALGATGGAFSGNAFIGPNGEVQFYYTERLPAYDLYKDYKEIQKLARPDAKLLKPVSIETVLEYGPEASAHDFRDPKVWFDQQRHCYLMVLAAAMDGNPAVLLYQSPNGVSWEFKSTLYQAPEHYKENGARCVECPDFFPLDDSWVLIMGFVGYTEPDSGRHNLLYALTGDFDGDSFVPYQDELQLLDFGTDFYAMQSFDDGQRQLAFAWLFNWEFVKPAGSNYCGEMSLPRELTLAADKQLLMNPEAGLETLRDTRLTDAQLRALGKFGTQTIELSLSGELNGAEIQVTNCDGGVARITHRDGFLELQVPEDDGSISYRSRSFAISSLRVILDRGVIELFANQGLVCGTRRSYHLCELASIAVITGSGDNTFSQEAWVHSSVW